MRILIISILLTYLVTFHQCEQQLLSDNDKSTVYKSQLQRKLHINSHRANSSYLHIERRNATPKIRRRQRKCKRQAVQYYYGGQYQPMPQYPVPQYGRRSPPYVLPQTYIPNRCNVYCNPCAIPNCRRNCLMDIYPGPGTRITTTHRPPTYYRTTRRWTSPTMSRLPTSPKYPCNCDPTGSEFLTCHVGTGQCYCKPHYAGKTCNICEEGYWKNQKKDCEACNCTIHGTLENTVCNGENGKCICKPGVGGKKCDECLPHHYGSIQSGCKKCDPCNEKGHICDPSNGKCVCPTLTEGKECQECTKNSWGYEPGIGCKECSCSKNGSTTLKCDTTTGKCNCKAGYEGENCDRCSYGYFDYPNCRECNCDVNGTEEGECTGGICKCNYNGSCKCKENVEGDKCNVCKPKTYGLSKDNPLGCITCFCFNRSDTCEDAGYKWNKIHIEKNIADTNDINDDILMLPQKFLGDLTTSYGGYLSIKINTGGGFEVFIKHNDMELMSSGNKEIKMIETEWRISSLGKNFRQLKLTRDYFMVVLQNVTSFLIKATDRIHEVVLDKAESDTETNYTVTHTIERCECPKEYAGLSCQNPNQGYHRYFPIGPENNNWIDKIVGEAKPCDCNGYSTYCDPESGYCKKCTNHTTGNHCHLCDVGFYNKSGRCAPCLCPNAEQNNAESCSPTTNSFICICKNGYDGPFCDRCSQGYYSNPQEKNALHCIPCGCNIYGVKNGSNLCDSQGQCKCKDGFRGKKCNECVKEREFIKDGICTPCDQCTQLLFNEIDNLSNAVDNTIKLFQDGLAPPWKSLADKIHKYNSLSKKYRKYLEKTNILLNEAQIEKLEAKLMEINRKIDRIENSAIFNENKINEINEKSNNLLQDSEQVDEILLNIIKNLNGFGTKQINLHEALERARLIRQEMDSIADKFNTQKDKEIYEYCSTIFENVNNIYKSPSKIPTEILADLENIHNDLIKITSNVEKKSQLSEEMNFKNSERLVKVKADIEKLKSKREIVSNIIEGTISKMQGIDDLLENLEIVYRNMTALKDFVELKQLENRVKRQEETSADIDDLYERVLDHVQDLESKINDYQGIFNFTKDEWRKINASGAFEAINSGIKKSKKLVEMTLDILDNVTMITEPDNGDNLVTQTSLAHAFSDRLNQRINNIKDISKDLAKIRSQLDNLKYSILHNGKSNNELTQILHKLEDQITSQSDRVIKLEEAITNSTNVSEDMRNTLKKVDNIYFEKEYLFFKEYQNYLNLTNADEINNLKKKLNATTKLLQNINITSTNLDYLQQYNNKNNLINLKSIEEKIKDLQKNIIYATQAVDTINVAMSLNKCGMTYLHRNPELFRSLSITFKCTNCELFKWSRDTRDILKLSVKDSKPTLTIGKKKTDLNNSNNTERTITIEKNYISLKIQIGNFSKQMYMEDDLGEIRAEDVIQIGDNQETSDGYVYKVLLNKQIFGIWKFSKTEGNCTGEKRNTTDISPESITFFNGQGYKVYGRKEINPTKVTISFEFQTFDENSLIYLAKDVSTSNTSCAFIALYLKDGYIVFHVVHNNNVTNIEKTNRKYNDGESHIVKITMAYDKGTSEQKYNLSMKDESHPAKKTLASSNVFRIKLSNHYFGGVPPTFNNSCIPISSSFLGFLDSELSSGEETMSYGIRKFEKGSLLSFDYAWFKPVGEIIMNQKKEKIDELKFLLRPTKPDGIVMKLSDSKVLQLIDYKLSISGIDEIDKFKLKKNEYNEVIITPHSFTLNKATINIDILQDFTVDELMHLGDSHNGFEGGIREIYINKKPVIFTSQTIVNFKNVEIGREKPSAIREKITTKSLSDPNISNSMQNTEGCASFNAYQTDKDAVKFGDEPNSFTHVRKNFWKKNFTVQFEFRALYPDGIIFASLNPKSNQYVILEIEGGKLVLSVKGKKQKAPVKFVEKLNNGKWHKVLFTRKKRKFTLHIDQEQKKLSKIPRLKLNDEIYFGGIPDNLEEEAKKNDELSNNHLKPFRGCMRSLSINDEHNILIKKSKYVKHSNIRQCFPYIEEGAYFGGDAYAVYKNDFHISKTLEVSFEFRTGEQNGVLLTVSNKRNSPAFSVELLNGGVVMAIENGNTISNVTNNLDSEFALCNNRWHNVTVMYSSSELTVNVDGIRKSWVQSDAGSQMDKLKAPLYIGGLPDNAPLGTLKSNENFKGCIRKLKIDDTLMEWSDMQLLSKVLLNCPMINNDKMQDEDEDFNNSSYTIIS